jgi:hypothetical protein
MNDTDWINRLSGEMAAAAFKDKRLARRLRLMVEKLGAQPNMSFPKVFSSNELEAAYRFFGNPAVTPELILSGHVEATRQRSLAQGRVLVVHDTTTVSFRADGQRAGLGRLRKTGQTFFAHVSLVLADDVTGRPLGVAAIRTWTRSEEPSTDEKARWAQQVEQAAQHLGEVPQVVHVMDREGDDYAMFAQLVSHRHRFIVRAKHNRLLDTDVASEPNKLNEAVARITCAIERKATLSKRVDAARSPAQKRIHPSRGARIARLAFGAAQLTFKRPTTQLETLPETLSLNVVRVWEPQPPAGEPPVEWTLVTNEAIDTDDDIIRVIDGYRARWTIEEFFKALKTGCAYEARQLEDYEGLVNALAVFTPIACQLLLLRSEARRAPNAPANLLVADDHIEVLRALGRNPLPPTPTARDILLAIAALGGHIKYAPDPGWLTLARGYAELITLTRGWTAAKLQLSRDQS